MLSTASSFFPHLTVHDAQLGRMKLSWARLAKRKSPPSRNRPSIEGLPKEPDVEHQRRPAHRKYDVKKQDLT